MSFFLLAAVCLKGEFLFSSLCVCVCGAFKKAEKHLEAEKHLKAEKNIYCLLL